jgi:hypothetical protein
MIYRDSRGKMIGKLDEGIFKKTVQKSKHLFRASNSWAIQERVLSDLADYVRIEIFDKEEKILYVTTATEWRKRGTYLEFGNYGLRAYLALEHFKQQPATARQLLKPEWV